ncbi:hypothetical protein [uncultured Methylobacterium sp.]|uniref:hypothetical protein n=1 Tax=uncultured Methylobacterium sp. TaxID=157278 RepID=UPI00258BCEC5|nr:hypothetical protein [uncultured Methylobacterium sp.]
MAKGVKHRGVVPYDLTANGHLQAFLLGVSGHCHAERSGAGDDLAAPSGAVRPTSARLETNGGGELGGYAVTHDKLLGAFEAAGVLFIEENGEGPGVRLRKRAL